MIDLIDRKYLSKGSSLRTVDFCRIAQYFALDVITELGFGKALGYLPNDTDVYEYIKTTEEALPFILVTNTLPGLLRFMRVTGILGAVSPKLTDKNGLGRFMRSVARHASLEERLIVRRFTFCIGIAKMMLLVG